MGKTRGGRKEVRDEAGRRRRSMSHQFLRPTAHDEDDDGGDGEQGDDRVPDTDEMDEDVKGNHHEETEEEEEEEEQEPEGEEEEEEEEERKPRGRGRGGNGAGTARGGSNQRRGGGHSREKVTKEEKLRRVLQGRLGQGFAMPEGEKTAFVDDMMAYLLRDWHRADFKPLRGHHH